MVDDRCGNVEAPPSQPVGPNTEVGIVRIGEEVLVKASNLHQQLGSIERRAAIREETLLLFLEASIIELARSPAPVLTGKGPGQRPHDDKTGRLSGQMTCRSLSGHCRSQIPEPPIRRETGGCEQQGQRKALDYKPQTVALDPVQLAGRVGAQGRGVAMVDDRCGL